MHIGVKRGSDRLDDLGTSPVVSLLQDQPDGPEPGEILNQCNRRERARHVDWLHFDSGPAAFFHDVADPALVREGVTWKDMRLRALSAAPARLQPQPRRREAGSRATVS